MRGSRIVGLIAAKGGIRVVCTADDALQTGDRTARSAGFDDGPAAATEQLKARIDACGTVLDAYYVTITNGRRVSPDVAGSSITLVIGRRRLRMRASSNPARSSASGPQATTSGLSEPR